MSRTRVKICGITNIDDAMVAVKAGADAIGLVFFEKSTRNVSISQAKKIIESLPAFVTSTALFVNADKEFIEQVIAQTKVDLLQFHGDESVEFCTQFARPYIKAIRIKETTDVVSLVEKYRSAQAILFDTYVAGTPGGTGESFNWQWLNASFSQQLKLPIILAGGLNANNVAKAVKIVQPWAVDISGGVEFSAGIKSAKKIQNFITEIEKVNNE
ncbi:MAG TPA: phosphoribosylanthranilate isomerase [Thiomicrospira sp.]|jgi:phosphoribosylanthranilate isomerase|nr:phosphoribosylanthranilate isomerase [Thiomicrospira sp.]